MLETFHNIVDECPCDYFWGGGVGGKVGRGGEGGVGGKVGWGGRGGKLLSDTRRHMQLVTRS